MRNARLRTARKWTVALVSGVIPAAFILALSDAFIRNLDAVLTVLAPLLGLGAKAVKQYAAIFAQLRHATIVLPQDAVALSCCALCLLSAWLVWGRKKLHGMPWRRLLLRCTVCALLWLPVLLAAFAACVWFTDVNGIRFGAAVGSLVKMILAGAF